MEDSCSHNHPILIGDEWCSFRNKCGEFTSKCSLKILGWMSMMLPQATYTQLYHSKPHRLNGCRMPWSCAPLCGMHPLLARMPPSCGSTIVGPAIWMDAICMRFGIMCHHHRIYFRMPLPSSRCLPIV